MGVRKMSPSTGVLVLLSVGVIVTQALGELTVMEQEDGRYLVEMEDKTIEDADTIKHIITKYKESRDGGEVEGEETEEGNEEEQNPNELDEESNEEHIEGEEKDAEDSDGEEEDSEDSEREAKDAEDDHHQGGLDYKEREDTKQEEATEVPEISTTTVNWDADWLAI